MQTGESPALHNDCHILQHRTVANIYPPYGLYPIFRACHNRTVLLFQVPYGRSVATWNTLHTVRDCHQSTLRTTFDLSTVRDSKVNRTVFPFSSTVRSFERVTLLYFPTYTVRFMADYRMVLVFQIPYGISIATWKIYIATYRTGLVFEPYGITFTEPYGTWISNTVRYVGNLHR